MSQKRYTSIAVALHWLIALLIIGQIIGGLYMHNLPNSAPYKFTLYQLHKSFGVSILLLTLFRLGWRIAHKPPPLPVAMPQWQKVAARAAHWLFYILLIVTPLSGWAVVSASPLNVPTLWFGLIEIPHLPIFAGAEDPRALEKTFIDRHEFLAYSILFLLALHVAAAAKHGFINRDGVLRSMTPDRRAFLTAGTLIVLFMAASISFLWMQKSSDPAPRTTPRDAANSQSGNGVAAVSVSPTKAAVGAPLSPHEWVVDYDRSSLRFVGEESGVSFTGEFKSFSADIIFDPNNLASSLIDVTVSVASIATGDELRDTTVKNEEWFDVDSYPEAIFESTTISRTGERTYEADGVLSIKKHSQNVVLKFSLTIEEGEANAVGSAHLVRTQYGLGTDSSWFNDENVSLDVRVEFEITARRQSASP